MKSFCWWLEFGIEVWISDQLYTGSRKNLFDVRNLTTEVACWAPFATGPSIISYFVKSIINLPSKSLKNWQTDAAFIGSITAWKLQYCDSFILFWSPKTSNETDDVCFNYAVIPGKEKKKKDRSSKILVLQDFWCLLDNVMPRWSILTTFYCPKLMILS